MNKELEEEVIRRAQLAINHNSNIRLLIDKLTKLQNNHESIQYLDLHNIQNLYAEETERTKKAETKLATTQDALRMAVRYIQGLGDQMSTSEVLEKISALQGEDSQQNNG